MTLLVRDEADVVETWLRYHLARGVDVVIATDHRSIDGTSEILHEHARDGRVVVLREEAGGIRQSEWTTRMSRLAATEHGADWVIPSDADEFWWPRGGSFAEILACVPERFGVVRGLMRNFVLVPGAGAVFERLTVRARATADLTSQYHAQVKVAHRGVADATVGVGNHDADGTGLRVIREWFPLEVLHFPLRSVDQLVDKFSRRPTTGRHTARAVELLARGEVDELLSETVVAGDALRVGLRDGSLRRDVRLRDGLRTLAETGSLPASPEPTLADDVDLADDAHVALEHDSAVIAERRCAALESAVARFDGRSSIAVRAARRLGRPGRGGPGDGS
jgi:Glycosyl transferase family 2